MGTELYCGEEFRDILFGYDNAIHGYLSLVVCVFGSVASLLSIVVLTRKRMVSPVSVLLTGLAVADMSLMLAYIPFSVLYILALCDAFPHLNTYHQYSWVYFQLFRIHFYTTCHGISVWITVTVAVWRYLTVCWPLRSKDWCGMRRTWWVVIAGYVFVPILCIPSYLTYEFTTEEVGSNGTRYLFVTSDLAYDADAQENTLFFKLNNWMLGMLFKLVPCAALTVLSVRVSYVLIEAKKRRKALTAGGTAALIEDQRKMHRTTRMLLVVLLFFLITEIPQGIVFLLTGTLPGFYDECSWHMTRVMEMMVLINSAINFVLYCTMSQEFRQTFKDLFVPKTMALPWARSKKTPGLNSPELSTSSSIEETVLNALSQSAKSFREDFDEALHVHLAAFDDRQTQMQAAIDSLTTDVLNLQQCLSLREEERNASNEPGVVEGESESSFV